MSRNTKIEEYDLAVALKTIITLDEDLKVFVAEIPALTIATQATTLQKVKLAIRDAVESYLKCSHDVNVKRYEDE